MPHGDPTTSWRTTPPAAYSRRMPHAWLVFVLLFVSIFAFANLFGPARRSDHDTRYRYKRTPLFNGTEHWFLIELRSLAPPHIAVLAKVRVADVLRPITDKNFAAFNRIARKHVDFVLYNTQSRKVVRAIELDGPTHASARARRKELTLFQKNASHESSADRIESA
jgi:hypothetical protein